MARFSRLAYLEARDADGVVLMDNTLLHEMQKYQKKHGKFWLHYFYKFYGIRWLDAHIGTEKIAECLYRMGYDRMKVWRMEETFKKDRLLRRS